MRRESCRTSAGGRTRLLEATPHDRGWPRARDVRALIIGGLRARAAANRRLSTTADIRLRVLLGVAIMMSAVAAGFLQEFATSSNVFATAHDTAASGWRELVAGLLMAAAATCAWRGRRRQSVTDSIPVRPGCNEGRSRRLPGWWPESGPTPRPAAPRRTGAGRRPGARERRRSAGRRSVRPAAAPG
jgi:hypothetical protein